MDILFYATRIRIHLQSPPAFSAAMPITISSSIRKQLNKTVRGLNYVVGLGLYTS